jgi:hypothetical protein
MNFHVFLAVGFDEAMGDGRCGQVRFVGNVVNMRVQPPHAVKCGNAYSLKFNVLTYALALFALHT